MTTDFGLKRNGSGYYDETAYIAMKRAEEDAMKPGEIWEGKDGREFLVIKNAGSFCVTLQLVEEEKRKDVISVMGKGKRYTHPAMLQYAFNTMLTTFVKELPENEFRAVLHAVQESLSLTISVKKAETDEQAKRIRALESELDDYKESYKTAFTRAAEMHTRLEDARRQLDEANERLKKQESDNSPNWRMMYESLVDKLVGRM